ncbi:S53 family peptidase [Conexibacter woesei]|uniref:S53 family peptidase n=1 Tax=Conexibacter woesei TaxID=191495 RepID=UPI000414FBAD|nr:S53 family peptidase [Conexibacter woesei]
MHRRLLALVAACAAVLMGVGAGGASARVLQQNALSRLDRAGLVSAAAPSTKLTIGISLARPDAAGEQALLGKLFDRSSAEYHQFLTPSQFAARFGVPAAQVDATKAWLQGGGLSVDYAAGAGDYLLASGTAQQVGALLRTSFDRFTFQGQSFLANVAAPTVPDALPVVDVLGLNTYQRFHTMRSEAPAATPGLPDIGNRSPEDLWSIYEQPSADTGAGVSVAILGNGATDGVIRDLHTFDTRHGLPQVPVDVVHTPANGDYSDTAGNPEWNIDMQAIHGMAPGITKEKLYFSPSLQDTQLVASSAAWANDPDGPPIMNASLGECEVTPLNDALNSDALFPLNGNENTTDPLPVTQGLSNSSEPAQTKVLQQAVIEGRTFFASSGDAGSSCGALYLPELGAGNGILNQIVPLTEDPANNPYATGVGGTVLYSDGGTPAQRALEYAWTHSGGNPSPFETAPAYQQGVANLNRPCLVDPTGRPTNTGQLCRGVPDVAAISGDVLSNGYTIVSDGADSTGGGTSLSSPLWAGMWARIAATAPAGSSYGFANEAIYAIGKDPNKYAQSFHDITQGTNGLNPAQTGYDYVTGFGVPRLSGLLGAVQSVQPATGDGGGQAEAPPSSSPPAAAPSLAAVAPATSRRR